MCRQKTIAVIFFSIIFSDSFGQGSFIFVRNHPENSEAKCAIELKWYLPELFGSSFKVYRRQANSGSAAWELISLVPVSKLPNLPAPTVAADKDLPFFIDLINRASFSDLQDDFLKLNVLLKSFESNEFARFLGIYYADGTAQFGESYEYKITIIEGAGETTLGQSGLITAGVYQRTVDVQSFEVYQEGNVINFNWELDETKYYAYNLFETDSLGNVGKLNEQPVMLSMQPDSSGKMAYPKPMFKRRGASEGVLYSYHIEGVDYFGDVSEPSGMVVMTFDDTTPPSPPTNLTGKADSLRVTLQWEQEALQDLKGFSIYRSPTSDGIFEPVSTELIAAGEQTYFETLPTPGPYYYQVEAEDYAGNTSRSAKAFVEAQDVFPPSQPADLVIRSDTGRFYLTWKENQESDLAGYLLYRTVDQNDPDHYVLLNAEPLDTNYYEQRLPKNVKNEFFYFLVAIDTSYNRSKPSSIATAVLPDVVAPEQPTISQIGYSEEGIIVNWTRNVEGDLAGYHLYRIDSLDPVGSQVNVALIARGSFRFIDRTAEPNLPYRYRLQAVDSTGNVSDYSEPAYAFLYEEKAIATELTLKLKSQKRKKTNRLEWTEIDPGDIKGYIVFRGQSENSIKPITGMLNGSTSFPDRGLQKEKYVYQVRAYAHSGQVIYSRMVEWNAK
jgi:uncharacterized protein